MDVRKVLKSCLGRRNLFAVLVCLIWFCLTAGVADAADPNLVAHWKFDEGSGSTAYDSIGDNDGTIYGAAWTTGLIDGALSFDGSEDYVKVNDSSSMRSIDGNTADYTISLWVKTTQTGADSFGPTVFERRDASPDEWVINIYLNGDNATSILIGIAGGSKYRLNDTLAINDGDWHHITVTRKNTEYVKIYVDGNPRQSGSTTISTSTNEFTTIGVRRSNAGRFRNHFNGTIDDVRIYDRSLSSEEIEQLYRDVRGELVDLEIIGPEEVRENCQSQYTAMASYDSGYTRYVTNWAEWWVEPNTIANIDTNGLLSSGDINVAEDITIYAEYAENGTIVGAEMTIQVTLHQILFVPIDFNDIQAAIDAAGCGDTIVVAPGTYTGPGNRDIDFLGKAITVRSTDPNNPNIVAATIIDCNGTEAEPHRGFRFWQGEDSKSVVAGLTIINGYAPITSPHLVATGGAIDCINSSPTIRQCVIRDNLADSGGGIFCSRSRSVIKNCKVIGNWARYGGGIHLHTCQSEIKNCLITDNTAWERNGAGVIILRCDATITNCTFSNNSAYDFGGAIKCGESTVTITNCILWDNSPSEIYERPGSNVTATYCDIQGGWPGEGNIEANPCFVKAGYWADANDPNIIVEPDDPNAVWVDGDYHLLRTSPCIDTGDPNYNPEPNETDLDGQPRLLDGDENGFPIIDMGAYEHRFSLIRADVRIKPKTLNLASHGEWISCHIRLPEDYNVADIDLNTVLLESEPNDIYPEWIWFEEEDKVVIAEFSRLAVQGILSDMNDVLEMGQARLTISGELMDGTEFVGTDTIRIINNKVYKETALDSLTFVLWSDTHYGKSNSTGKAVGWIKNKNPDFIFHLGDITHRGELGEFAETNADFDSIIEDTNADNIWFTLGGGHDGYLDHIWPPNWNGAGFLRDRKLTSLWYTIKKGNNVFIFCNNINGKKNWASDWGTGLGPFIPQNKIDWLEGQLAKWDNTENNIWIITHMPLRHTNVYTHEWAGMKLGRWITTSNKIKNLLSKYRVDVFMNGHVHIDPDKSHSSHPNVSGGNVVLGTSRDDLPDKTTFLHVPSVCWRHGREKWKKSTYPAVMYFDLREGENYFDLKAARVDTISPVNITYNDGSESLRKIRVPLSYPIEGMNGSNIDFFEQGWGVWRYSNEGDYQWYKDSEGLMTKNDSWIISRWDLWEEEIIVDFDVIWNEMGSLSHEFYCSNDDMNTWDGPYNNASDLGICRWVEVRTMIYPSDIVYIYDMKLLVCDIEAEMRLTPQTLNCKSKANFVKAYITLPEEFTPEDVDVGTPALAYPMRLESEYLETFVNDYGLVELEIGFDRQAFCDGIGDGEYLDVTVVGSLITGQYFYGADTIRIIKQ